MKIVCLEIIFGEVYIHIFNYFRVILSNNLCVHKYERKG